MLDDVFCSFLFWEILELNMLIIKFICWDFFWIVIKNKNIFNDIKKLYGMYIVIVLYNDLNNF